MILPVYVYGHPLLRQKSVDIAPDYPELANVISDMFDTMYHTNGVGLAAPQVGRSIRLFVVDGKAYEKDEPELANFRKIFLNARMLEETGEPWGFNEGCLSVPTIREDIMRKSTIRIAWQDENFDHHEEVFTGIAARIIQHEYDHLEGVLFVDKVSNLKKTLLRRRLMDISKGKAKVDYRIVAPDKNKKRF
ncbi:MAG: peptide deformylase [Bacteroidetes bacterium]|nr:peptide deformylase [Bacteroidota bacterium]